MGFGEDGGGGGGGGDRVARVLRTNLRRALRSGNLEEAGTLLERLREREPLARATRALELELAVRAGRFDEAELLAEQLLELFPDSAHVRFWAGRLAYRRRRYPEAVEQLAESERLHPHPWSRSWLARALTQAGRFDEAERLLRELLAAGAGSRRDLAWLYERRGETECARHEIETYLEDHPDDRLARDQLLRLEAAAADPETVEEEVETLDELGEEVPGEVLLVHCERLVQRGRQDELRRLLAERRPHLERRLAVRLAWMVYRYQLWDLAFDLFGDALPGELENFKLLSALEAAARRCDRLPQLLELYARHAEEAPGLYGRSRRIESGLRE